jgi:hypothetical protein
MVEWITILGYAVIGGAILWYGLPLLLKILVFILNKIRYVFLFIKNRIVPIKLPKYKWKTAISYTIRDNYANIKFYATKNWVEIFINDSSLVNWLDSGVDSQNHNTANLIIPKWKVISYDKEYFQTLPVSKKDYKRYREWHK